MPSLQEKNSSTAKKSNPYILGLAIGLLMAGILTVILQSIIFIFVDVLNIPGFLTEIGQNPMWAGIGVIVGILGFFLTLHEMTNKKK